MLSCVTIVELKVTFTLFCIAYKKLKKEEEKLSVWQSVTLSRNTLEQAQTTYTSNIKIL